jgi:hypothetical protein
LAHAEQFGNSWSHFVFRDRQRLQAEMDREIWPPELRRRADPDEDGGDGAPKVGRWVVGEGMLLAGEFDGRDFLGKPAAVPDVGDVGFVFMAGGGGGLK